MKDTKSTHALTEQLVEMFANDTSTSDPGSLLYGPDRSAGQLLLVHSGSVRMIDHGRMFGSLTATKINGPALFGIGELLSVPSKEELRAITSCTYTLIEIKQLDPAGIKIIRTVLLSEIEPSEYLKLASLVQKERLSANNEWGSINDIKHSFKLLDPDHVAEGKTVVYLDTQKQGFKYGQIITPQICNTFFSSKEWPRLAILDQKPVIKRHTQNKTVLSSQEASDESRIDDERQWIPLTPELQTEAETSSDDGFRVVKANNFQEAFAACLTMLVQFYELPTRRDTITRAAEILSACKPIKSSKQGEDQSVRLPWTNRFLSILDELGLAVRLVQAQTKRPLRIPTPSVWIDIEGNAKLITRATSKELVIIDPREGRQKLSENEAGTQFKLQPELISVDIGLHTPRKRFSLRWLFPYVKRYRLQLIEVFSASFLNQLFALATPLLFQQIIDRVISKGAFDALGPLVILMLMFTILETVFSSLRTFQFVEVSNRIDIGVGSAILSRLLRINARFFDKRSVGELASRLGELENIRRFLTGTALTVVLDAFFSLLYFSVMFFYSPLLASLVILTLPLLFGVTLGVTPITQKLIRARAEAASRTQSLLVEILGGIQTVKLQNAELTARRQWEDRHLNSINQGFKAVLANTTSSNALQLINKISSILVIGVGAWLVLRNELTLGQLIAFRIISGYVTQPMLRLASTWQSFQELSLSLERVGDVVNQPLEISEEEEANVVMPSIQGDISVVSLGYTYSSNSRPVLSSVSLEISAGSFVGLVGQSGCGKSTLLKMIPRLYRPTSGKLLIDQLDISKVDLYSLRTQIGFVPQDCLLFEGTVFSNIALGDPQVESNRVIEMAKIACAHEFIMELPYGYSTPVGEKGSGLSGGQRQRIALARMLLEDPNMVVLDEATSALDVDTERQVVANLRTHLSGRTLLMITHRLSTLIEADQIVIMHSGKVDESGTHQKLMDQKGRYFALYQSQFGES